MAEKFVRLLLFALR